MYATFLLMRRMLSQSQTMVFQRFRTWRLDGGAGDDGRTYISAAATAQLEGAPHISDCWFDPVVLELSAVIAADRRGGLGPVRRSAAI